MSKFGANLPAVLNPVGDTCVQVYIPNHPDYIKLFVRAVRMLEVNRMYQRDETMEGAKIVTAQWRDRTITPLIEALASSTGSCGVDGECLAYPPFASFISYSPQNPYTEPDLIPEGFEQPPFYVNGKDPAHDLPNYNKGDVILDFGSINIEPSWDLAKTPRIELCLEGSGVCEIHFLNIVQGGVAIISLDNPVDLGDIIAGIIGDGINSIDLNQDIVALPPETAEEIIIEVEVPLEGEHIIYIYFLPVVNDSLIPLSFGGGLREISLCGNLRPCGTEAPPPPPPLDGVTELKPQFQFTPDCGLEYRLLNQDDEIVQDWTAVEGWTENAALCFAVGGGDVATKEDIREALKEWTQWGAQLIARGEILPFAVDEDGEVDTDTGGGDAGLPEDDPATVFNETSASRMGGAAEAANLFEDVLARIDTLYGAVNGTPVYTAADAETVMAQIWDFDAAELNAAITNYYSYRATQPRFLWVKALSFAQYMYCRGVTAQVAARYLIDVIAFVFAKQNAMLMFWFALTQEAIDAAYTAGLPLFSTDYLGASCTPAAIEEFTLDMSTANNVQYTTNAVYKSSHRLLIEVSGSFVDSDVPNTIQDFFYTVNTSTGAKTFLPSQFAINGAGITEPTQAYVPYQDSHSYAVTVDIPSASSGTIIFGRDNDTYTVPNVTGILTFKVTDLGEYAS